jgi:hypothetical protein
VRIGATWDDVLTHTGTSQELLFPGDYTSVTAWTYRIEPGDSKLFDASGFAPDYFLFIQNGWWDAGDCTLTGPLVCDWDKHVSRVAACAPNSATPTVCPDTTYKWAGVTVTAHTGRQVVLLSDFLPPGNWCSSTFCN